MGQRSKTGPRLFPSVLKTLALLLAVGETAIAQDACGTPQYDPAAKTAMYIWRDCPSNNWHVRVTSSGDWTRFDGTVDAQQAFTAVDGVELEPADVLNTSDPDLIDFRLGVSSPWQDGFDFSLPADANACVSLPSPAGASVLAGADELGVGWEFDLQTLGPCDGAVRCGAPDIDYSADRHAFLWKDCDSGGWHARFAAGGGDWLRYDGMVTSDSSFTSVKPVELESGDLLTVNGDIGFSLGVIASGADGFDFSVGNDAGTCFHLDAPENTPVLLGPERASTLPPFDLATGETCGSAPQPNPEAYNIVVVFADDQRFDTQQFMPNVESRLLPEGVEFENAYVPTPLCCPARASTYSGGFLAQNTGVLTNGFPNGGRLKYQDSENLGTRLQSAGYRTMFVGKWLNDYPLLSPYVPPGWSNFVGRASWASTADWSSFRYARGSSGAESSVGTEVDASGQYHVYYERDRIIEFLGDGPAEAPWFVFWATTPPHPPATPAGEDTGKFSDYVYRGRGYGESDLSDKPQWVQTFNQDRVKFIGDEAVRDQLRSVLAVDRSIGALIDAIDARGELGRTVFIITSDNGYMWGEHGLWGKNYAYEESIRAPMLIVMPGVAPRVETKLVSAVLDLGPTLYDIAGVQAPSDGRSLVPLLQDPTTSWRNELFFEKYHTSPWVNALWTGLRRGRWKYVEYWNGDEELYDLASDPYELENQAGNPSYDWIRTNLAARVDELQGPSIKPRANLPDGQVGAPYSHNFEAWGGTPPFEWEVAAGSLPPGLGLHAGTGELRGTPTSGGTWVFRVRVTGSAIASQTGNRRTFVTGAVTVVIL